MPRRSRYGLPVIGTTAGAIREPVPAGAGMLVAPDDVAALAGALRRLIADRGRARASRRGRAPRRRAAPDLGSLGAARSREAIEAVA